MAGLSRRSCSVPWPIASPTCLPAGRQAGEITLTTYYPSPRGVYQELRTSGNVQIGSIEAPGVADQAPRLHVVRRNADTDPADTGFPAFLVEDEIPNATTPDATPFIIDGQGNVGIGTMDPKAALDINGFARLGAPFTPPGTARLIEGGAGTIDGADKVFYSDVSCIEGVVRGSIETQNNQVALCVCANNPAEAGKGWYCFD